MMSRDDIEKNFRSDLMVLLKKYDATLSAEDHFSGYAECGQDIRMNVSIDAKYDSDGNIIKDHAEIDLGNYMGPTDS